MMDGFNNNWGMGFGFGWVIGLIILVLLIWLVVKVVSQNHKLEKPDIKTPLDILKDRYAKGEISKVEFEEKKIDLK